MKTAFAQADAPSRPARFVLLSLLLVAAGLLCLDFFLKLSGGAGLCSAQACAVVGGYVKGGERVLIALGAVFFLTLWSLYFFAGRYPSRVWLTRLGDLVFLAGAAFDGTILGYQFFTLGEFCPLCIGMGATLLVLALARAWHGRSLFILLLLVAVWGSSLTATNVLYLPRKTPTLENTAFYYAKGETEYPKRWLFFSMRCPHCAEAMFALAAKKPATGGFGFASIDLDEADLAKLDGFAANNMTALNPFLSILALEGRDAPAKAKASAELKRTAYLANVFLGNSGIGNVPLLVVESEPERREYYIGTEAIMEYGRRMN